jgi:hypothetical protein
MNHRIMEAAAKERLSSNQKLTKARERNGEQY